MESRQQLTDQLAALGFSTNEAKAYIALVACQPATPYEIAKQAGIPSSKIYETVNRMVTRGVFQSSLATEGKDLYLAMSPTDLMSKIRETTIRQTEQLLPGLEKLTGEDEPNLIWPLLDQLQVQSRALQLVSNATESILVSLWAEELDWLDDALREAEARGVRVALVHFGEPQTVIGATYHHPVEKTLYEEKGGRGLTLVADGAEVVIANYRRGGEIDGAWSRNQTFVTVAEDYVKHDVYITKVTRFLGSEMKQRFGEDYARLRDVFDAEA